MRKKKYNSNLRLQFDGILKGDFKEGKKNCKRKKDFLCGVGEGRLVDRSFFCLRNDVSFQSPKLLFGSLKE